MTANPQSVAQRRRGRQHPPAPSTSTASDWSSGWRSRLAEDNPSTTQMHHRAPCHGRVRRCVSEKSESLEAGGRPSSGRTGCQRDERRYVVHAVIFATVLFLAAIADASDGVRHGSESWSSAWRCWRSACSAWCSSASARLGIARPVALQTAVRADAHRQFVAGPISAQGLTPEANHAQRRHDGLEDGDAYFVLNGRGTRDVPRGRASADARRRQRPPRSLPPPAARIAVEVPRHRAVGEDQEPRPPRRRDHSDDGTTRNIPAIPASAAPAGIRAGRWPGGC